MSFTLGTNIAALKAQRRVALSSAGLSRSYDRLSSGLRINRASDDAAGLSIASSLQVDSRLYTQAVRNANDGLSALSIAEGALRELSGIVTRIIELAEQSANGIYGDRQRIALDREGQALRDEYARIAGSTSFNGISLLDNPSLTIGIQVGVDSSSNSQIDVQIAGGTYTVGDGTFQTPPDTIVGPQVQGVDLGDLNNDGFDDIITWHNSIGGGSVFLSNGDGTFKAPISMELGSNGMRRGTLADVNNDGNLDWVGPAYTHTTVSLGNGDGTFKYFNQYLIAPGGSTTGVSVGDFNGDGYDDLVADDGTNNRIFVFLNNGNGTFKARVSYNGPGGEFTPEVGDLNGDGRLDIVSGEQVYLGNGDGTFKNGVSLFVSGARDPRLIDVNDDGNLDLVGADGASGLFVLVGNGNGTFKAQVSYATGSQNFNMNNIAYSDFNGDGALDITVGEEGSSTIGVFLNNGNGTFRARVSYSVPVAGSAIAVGDINGDGVDEIVTAEYSVSFLSGTLSIFSPNVTQRGGLAEFSLRTAAGAMEALTLARATLEDLSASIGSIGAAQSRISTAVSNAQVAGMSSAQAASRIMDVDVAEEAAELVKRGIIQQSATSVLSQANQQPAIVLSLLRSA